MLKEGRATELESVTHKSTQLERWKERRGTWRDREEKAETFE